VICWAFLGTGNSKQRGRKSYKKAKNVENVLQNKRENPPCRFFFRFSSFVLAFLDVSLHGGFVKITSKISKNMSKKYHTKKHPRPAPLAFWVLFLFCFLGQPVDKPAADSR
jgi:hypothetical protein